MPLPPPSHNQVRRYCFSLSFFPWSVPYGLRRFAPTTWFMSPIYHLRFDAKQLPFGSAKASPSFIPPPFYPPPPPKSLTGPNRNPLIEKRPEASNRFAGDVQAPPSRSLPSLLRLFLSLIVWNCPASLLKVLKNVRKTFSGFFQGLVCLSPRVFLGILFFFWSKLVYPMFISLNAKHCFKMFLHLACSSA